MSTAALMGVSLVSSVTAAADATSSKGMFDIRPLPAACRLLPEELRHREATLLRDLRAQIEIATPLTDGYALQLKPADANLQLGADVIAVERQCCPFLQFSLTCAQESRALLLEIRGPAGSRELLAQLLRLENAGAKP